MTKIKAVIGANYGDEGKGFTTDYLCGEALKKDQKCLVVCSNGGGQRGHTVETDDGMRFVFHHMGSGSLLGIGTFFCADYILNPMIFENDWSAFQELRENYPNLKNPKFYADRNCRFSTPFDMMVNQIIEDARGNRRHGSVGVGIWETVRRYEKGLGITFGEFMDLGINEKIQFLKMVRTYAEKRIEAKLKKNPAEMERWADIWNNEQIFHSYIEDCYRMMNLTSFTTVQELAQYDILVIENAQGVLLGQNRYDGKNNTTPSDTGAREIKRLLDAGMNEFVDETELYYVSRTYITKHGAGDFEEECAREEINPDIYDLTNVPNGYQGTIRYGHLNPAKLAKQIREDLMDMENEPYKVNLLLTHANEASAEPVIEGLVNNGWDLENEITVLTSDGRTRTSVK